jgi:predicted negative regulator of RcsB-dependent stress response
MPELTSAQIERQILDTRERQLKARARGDDEADKLIDVRLGVLLQQWQATHDAEMLDEVPTS